MLLLNAITGRTSDSREASLHRLPSTKAFAEPRLDVQPGKLAAAAYPPVHSRKPRTAECVEQLMPSENDMAQTQLRSEEVLLPIPYTDPRKKSTRLGRQLRQK